MSACTSSHVGPDSLTVSAEDYSRAFNVAVDVARDYGMAATLRDRRMGVIETNAAVAGSILEPWHWRGATFSQTATSTANHEQRRARFEFIPAVPSADEISDRILLGPDFAGMSTADRDLSAYQGNIELRAWVVLERAYEPGVRRNSWTRRHTSRSTSIPAGRQAQPLPSEFWVPARRDQAAERRLLLEIERRLAARPGAETISERSPPDQS